MAKSKSSSSAGIMLVKTYFVLFIVNSLVIHLANLWFPQFVVLGTGHLTRTWAIILSMAELSLINTFAVPFIRQYEKKRGKMYTNQQWMIKYFLINFVGIWLIARFSDQLGMGISAWPVAAVLAIALDFVQGAAMMKLEKSTSK